ncbi:hypothetical protein EV182_006188, partial [Spiromyces aspiralis]
HQQPQLGITGCVAESSSSVIERDLSLSSSTPSSPSWPQSRVNASSHLKIAENERQNQRSKPTPTSSTLPD